jgi:adenylylsulfate kinase
MKHLNEQQFNVLRSKRSKINKHRSFVVWFTGLSGSGKTTLSNLLENKLYNQGVRTYLLDGDHLRLGINRDLGFTEKDRSENMRRVGEISKLMVDAGLVTIAAFVSPFERNREMDKEIIGRKDFIEIFISTPLDECIRRDSKGLYKKALKGEISDFTGISSPYEKPLSADLTIEMTNISIDSSHDLVYDTVKKHL